MSWAGYITFFFSANLGGTVATSVTFATYAIVSILDVTKQLSIPQNLNVLQSDSPPLHSTASYRPGDIVPVRFTYSGFNPNENTVLFYSIEKYSTEHPIMQKDFVTSVTGEKCIFYML